MKVVLVTPSFPSEPIDGDSLAMSLEIAVGLQSVGHEVLVVTLSSDNVGEDVVHGMRVLRVLPKFDDYNGLAAFPQLMVPSYWLYCSLALFEVASSAVDQFNPDIIECHDCSGLGMPWVTDGKYPVLIRMIGSLAEMMRNGSEAGTEMARHFAIMSEIATVGGAALAVSLCDDLVDKMKKLGGLPDEHFRTIRTPLRAAVGLPERAADNGGSFPRLLFWGRVDPQKGCEYLIEALPKIAKAYPRVKLVMAGVAYHASYETRLKARVAEFGLSENVQFPGPLSRADLMSLAVNSDLCVFPSRYETACYAALEAMSYGCCVVATKVGGLAEYVEHDLTGWLVPDADSDALADAIIQLSGDDDLRQRLARTAAIRVLEVCDPAKAIAQSEAAYADAILRFRPPLNAGRFPAIAQTLSMALADRSLFKYIQTMREEGYAEGNAAAYAEVASKSLAQAAMVPEPAVSYSTASRVKRLARRFASAVLKK